MQVVHPCCCGLDVQQGIVTACVVWAGEKAKKVRGERSYGKFTHDLLQLADWLRACGVTQLAMESTGVY